jgi:hypothetical protein
MDKRTLLKTLLAIGLALQIPSKASACRVGWDQHLFEESPAANVLPSAQIIYVHFSNASPGLDSWPGSAADPALGSAELAQILIRAASPAIGGELPLLNPRAARAALVARQRSRGN